jgi:hypothetical protein
MKGNGCNWRENKAGCFIDYAFPAGSVNPLFRVTFLWHSGFSLKVSLLMICYFLY